MDQKIINLYDEYTHKPLSREVFIKKLIMITGSMAMAMSVLPMLEGNYAVAAVAEKDDNLFTEEVEYEGAAGTKMKAYIARPTKESKYPGVMVIHENRGLNPHIKDVARRVAMAGYTAIAPDALSPLGGTPANEDDARGLFNKLDTKDTLTNFLNGLTYLAQRNDCDGNLGCVGFCWGGAMANQLAVHAPDLKAAVPFYGRQPDAADVPNIRAALQLHYGGLDERIDAGIPAFEAALKANNKPYEIYIYEGANHAFHNDTSAARYNEAAAKLAWSRTLEFFKKHLK
ncbi:MAG: dienelactone hydrolase family protein [Ferruginibacter sp.]